MRSRSRKTRRFALPALLAALALVATACGDGATELVEDTDDTADATEEAPAEDGGDEEDAAAGDPVEGGTVVMGVDQEPAIVNPFTQEGNLAATSYVTAPVLSSLFRVSADLEFEPLLLEGEPEVEEDPLRVTYTLHPDAVWSDGEPITAEDVEFTLEQRLNPDVEVVTREGYDRISDVEIHDEKSWTFEFDTEYAPWRTLFADQSGVILPKHVLEGEDINEVWREEIPISSGPFLFEEWNQGVDMTLVRNDEWWGDGPYLDQITFRFLEDSSTQVQQLRGGEIDILQPQPQIDLVEQLDDIGDVTTDVAAGTNWEFITWMTDGTVFENRYVREAVARAVDRQGLVDALIAPIQPDAEPLNSIFYTATAPEYQPNWEEAMAYDPEAAVSILEENCDRDSDDIFVCDGERLEIDYATTSGNERRELTFEVLQQQLAEVGIALNADFSEASVLFGTRLWEYDFEMASWGLTGRPDPVAAPSQWGCLDEERGTGTQNFTLLCNDEATDLLLEANRTPDPEDRAAMVNEADAMLAEDLIAIPLYQTPVIMAFQDRVQGTQTNPSSAGPTWNTQDWYLND